MALGIRHSISLTFSSLLACPRSSRLRFRRSFKISPAFNNFLNIFHTFSVPFNFPCPSAFEPFLFRQCTLSFILSGSRLSSLSPSFPLSLSLSRLSTGAMELVYRLVQWASTSVDSFMSICGATGLDKRRLVNVFPLTNEPRQASTRQITYVSLWLQHVYSLDVSSFVPRFLAQLNFDIPTFSHRCSKTMPSYADTTATQAAHVAWT